MNAFINALLLHLWESSWFALVCVVLIISLDRLRCARARHLIAWLGLIKFLLPLAWISTTLNPAEWSLFQRDAPEALATALQLNTWAQLPSPQEDQFTWSPLSILVTSVWIIGLFGLTALLIRRIVSLRQQLNQETVPADSTWQADAARLWQSNARAPQLRFARTNDLPAGVFGWLRPAVIIPPHLQANFDASEREAFLRHEFQHLYKRDPLWLLLQINLRNLLWMHPLLWWLEHRIRTERELIRDQEVIHKTNNPKSYLSCLMKASKIELNEPRATSVCLNGSPFARRVKAIARAGRSGVASILSASASFAALAAFALFLSAAQVPALAGNDHEDHDERDDHDQRMGREVRLAVQDLGSEIEELSSAVRNIAERLEKAYTKDRPSHEEIMQQREMQEKLGRYKERLAQKERQLSGIKEKYADHALQREEGEDREKRNDERSERSRDRDEREERSSDRDDREDRNREDDEEKRF